MIHAKEEPSIHKQGQPLTHPLSMPLHCYISLLPQLSIVTCHASHDNPTLEQPPSMLPKCAVAHQQESRWAVADHHVPLPANA
jgi:hypothetical protein